MSNPASNGDRRAYWGPGAQVAQGNQVRLRLAGRAAAAAVVLWALAALAAQAWPRKRRKPYTSLHLLDAQGKAGGGSAGAKLTWAAQAAQAAAVK